MGFEDSLGLGWLDAIHPDDREATLRRWAEAAASGEYYVEHRVRRGADGGYRWHHARALALRGEDGATLRWIGTNTDIEDQKTTTRRLEALNAGSIDTPAPASRAISRTNSP